MIQASKVAVHRGGKQILHDIDLCAPDHHMLGIVGPNGSGKSTLLLALYRAIRAQGEVLIDATPLSSLRRKEIAARIAIVAQERDTALALNVYDCVALGRLARKSVMNYGDQADQELISAALAKLHLTHLAYRPMSELSGGEKQRVLIARAIVQQASHLFLDEPTNHLDMHYQYELLALVRSLECSTIVVLHDLNLAARFCDHIVVLDQGEVAASGTPEQVLRPEILEPIYRMRITSMSHNGKPFLVFDPL